MQHIRHIPIAPRDPSCFAGVLGAPTWDRLDAQLRTGVAVLNGRTVWNVNTTASGGGVAEMLRSLVAYARGVGADVRWAVIVPPAGAEDFFTVTKRIHNMLHGHAGDGLGLDRDAREAYLGALGPVARDLCELVRPGDVVILHDPQTAGLVPAIRSAGAGVIWRCHVGTDVPNARAHEVWDFLRPFVEQADRRVFSRPAHVWAGLERDTTLIVAPSIDPFSPKNQDLTAPQVDGILGAAGLCGAAVSQGPMFAREDGTGGSVTRPVQMLGASAIDWAAPLVTQVSRWDALKDPLGVMEGFVHHVMETVPDAQLALVGPETAAVSDDPEGARVLEACRDAWAGYPAAVRERVALVCLPMADLEENAAVVNAIQRRSTVIVQKSLAEGFGLTVSEAMWKQRPVVASRAGGISDQIVAGDSGVLVQDPGDLREFGQAVSMVLQSPDHARAMGMSARRRVAEHFLTTRSLVQYAGAVASLERGGALRIAA